MNLVTSQLMLQLYHVATRKYIQVKKILIFMKMEGDVGMGS